MFSALMADNEKEKDEASPPPSSVSSPQPTAAKLESEPAASDDKET
jgi:hypothetical protein